MKPRHIKALRRAVDEAEVWRGSMTGNPDPEPLEEFDAFIAEAREALGQAGREAKELRRLREIESRFIAMKAS